MDDSHFRFIGMMNGAKLQKKDKNRVKIEINMYFCTKVSLNMSKKGIVDFIRNHKQLVSASPCDTFNAEIVVSNWATDAFICSSIGFCTSIPWCCASA